MHFIFLDVRACFPIETYELLKFKFILESINLRTNNQMGIKRILYFVVYIALFSFIAFLTCKNINTYHNISTSPKSCHVQFRIPETSKFNFMRDRESLETEGQNFSAVLNEEDMVPIIDKDTLIDLYYGIRKLLLVRFN